MTSPVNNFQDILNAMEREPALRDALRRHILTEELLQVPVRLERMEGDISTLKQDVDTLKVDVGRMGGDISRIRGNDYESHVAAYARRFLRRRLGINANVFSTQSDKSALTGLPDEAEAQGIIGARETDELDKADLVLTTDGPTDYLLAEVSITIQQDDIDRAAERARLLARVTARTVTPFAIGAREEPDLRREHVPGAPHPGVPGALNHRAPANSTSAESPRCPDPVRMAHRGPPASQHCYPKQATTLLAGNPGFMEILHK